MSIADVHRPLIAAALAATASLFIRSVPAHAQGFVPPPLRWLDETPAPRGITPVPQVTPLPPMEMLEERAAQPSAAPSVKPTPLVGVSFNYVARSEDLEINSTFRGKSDVSVYTGRVDTYLPGCSFGDAGVHCPATDKDKDATQFLFNVGVLAGHAEGSSSVAGLGTTKLEGPVLGVSTLLYLQGPVMKGTEANSAVFVLTGFDYAATDYSEIEGWVHAYGVKPRIGLMVQTAKDESVSVYGGASWERFSEEQTLSDTDTELRVQPERPWTGLLGASYANRGRGKLGGVSFTAEGEAGSRTGVLVSLRYEFGIPR